MPHYEPVLAVPRHVGVILIEHLFGYGNGSPVDHVAGSVEPRRVDVPHASQAEDVVRSAGQVRDSCLDRAFVHPDRQELIPSHGDGRGVLIAGGGTDCFVSRQEQNGREVRLSCAGECG